MKNNRKLIIFASTVLIISITAACVKTVSAGLNDFKQEFQKTESDDSKNSQDKKEESQQSGTSSAQSTQSSQPAQDSTLKNFKNDFQSPANNNSSGNNDNSYQNNYNYDYYRYPTNYYRYNNPYYYPYNSYYPEVIIMPSNTQYNSQTMHNIDTSQIVEQERYTWCNATLQSQRISETISSVGMIYSIISAGRADETSYGLKFDYSVFTEKIGQREHVSMPLYFLGWAIGKQAGNGLAEMFLAYANLDGLTGISIKLSTDQFIEKYLFVRAGIGVSSINSNPLTEVHGGIGISTSWAQIYAGYKTQSSVMIDLNGPEIKIALIF